MKYSVCVDSVFRNKGSFVEAMEIIKQCGYKAIEFWTWEDKDIEKIIVAKEKLGLEIATFCTKFVNPGVTSLQEEFINGLKESIQVAKRLNCKTLITQAGYEVEGVTYEDHRKSLLEVLKKSAPIAETEGITLLLEPLNLLVDHAGYHLSISRDAFEIIDEVNSPNIKVLFDIYHQQITEGNLIYNITTNIDKIGHIHTAGNPGRTNITEGEIAYRNVFEAISKTDYKGYIGLEYMTKNDPKVELEKTKTVLI